MYKTTSHKAGMRWEAATLSAASQSVSNTFRGSSLSTWPPGPSDTLKRATHFLHPAMDISLWDRHIIF
ncbi:hypothetical protein O3P69_001515 [Scylla paramamosain]|uniref:Uncharacterized protein n=1 Tax=Scylla paramamosain TaxID=85552 RepID=A0AAW0V0H3_SCYPA